MAEEKNCCLQRLSLKELLRPEGFSCACGKVHRAVLKYADIGPGALKKLPERVRQLGGTRVQMYCDHNTQVAAGKQAEALLMQAGIDCNCYCFPQKRVYADAAPVGQAVMHFDKSCDLIVGVGTGTINDICKIMAGISGRPYIIVGTAPSMDGFASDTSSMVVDGLKSSLPSAGAQAIIGDSEILAAAPMEMIRAGLGDMLAKYISICEWRLSHEINGEYYCPQVAQLVRSSLQTCVAHADGLAVRDPEAVQRVMEGLVLSGLAMGFAGVTRPASGMEHYFSHLWDMRALEFGWEEHLHGEQVGIGTLLSLKIYERLQNVQPDRQKALAAAAAFSPANWKAEMRAFLGNGAEGIIALEQKEGKFDIGRHAKRLEVILQKWPQLQQIMKEELPETQRVETLLKKLGAKTEPQQLGMDQKTVRRTFVATKDIRDKYIGSRLLWDLGLLEEFADFFFGQE